MGVEIYNVGENGTAWGGALLISREFYNPATGDYLALEAHECKGQSDHGDGTFLTALWVPYGNRGDSSIPTDLHSLVKWMQDFPVPEGMVEGTIPEALWR